MVLPGKTGIIFPVVSGPSLSGPVGGVGFFLFFFLHTLAVRDRQTADLWAVVVAPKDSIAAPSAETGRGRTSSQGKNKQTNKQRASDGEGTVSLLDSGRINPD